MSLANGLLILFIFSKNQLLALLIFAMVSFVSFAFSLLLGRKVMTNLQIILKSRDIVKKGPSNEGYGFSSVPQVLGCCVFIFIHFYAYFDFFFDLFCDLLVIQQRVVQPPYVGFF